MYDALVGSILSENGRLSEAPALIVGFAVASLALSLILIGILFTSRIVRSHYVKRETRLRYQYQKILNKVVVHEAYSEPGAVNPAFEFYMAELRLIVGRSRFASQLLITQIMEIKKCVTGNSAAALLKTYYAMELDEQSLRKLKRRSWQKKALAVRELAEMRHHESAPLIEKYLYSSSEILRQESFMALAALEEKPLSFLGSFKGGISPWMQINIHRYLKNLDYQHLPVFSSYFNHPELSVRLFAINMAAHFKQTASLPGLVDMLYSDNARVVGRAISALGIMEAFEYKQHVIRMASHVWRFERLSRLVVQCMGRIGSEESDVAIVARFLHHPCYSVRFQAVAAMKALGFGGESMPGLADGPDARNLSGMLRHFSEPLLS